MEFVEYFYDDFKTNLSLIIAAILIVSVMCAAGKLKKEALTHVFFAILIVAGPSAIISYNQYAQFNNTDCSTRINAVSSKTEALKPI